MYHIRYMLVQGIDLMYYIRYTRPRLPIKCTTFGTRDQGYRLNVPHSVQQAKNLQLYVPNIVHYSNSKRRNVLNTVHVFQIRYIVKLYRLFYTEQMRVKQDPRALLR